MLLVIDIGNTRTKWTYTDDNGQLSAMQTCLNGDIAKANFLIAPVKKAQIKKVLIANVAGEKIAQQITQLLAPLPVHFVQAQAQACGLTNRYLPTLGADRWAALVAAWHINKCTTLVVDAGTAITMDGLVYSKLDASSKDNGLFLGGTIMPGLRLMQQSLLYSTAQLDVAGGMKIDFPTNTSDAIETGCLNAVIGAIHVMLNRLEAQSGTQASVIISGGDADKIANATMAQLKRVMIIQNLVLQGLVLLESEHA